MANPGDDKSEIFFQGQDPDVPNLWLDIASLQELRRF